MRSVLTQVLWQVNNCNRFKRAFLDTDTAADAQGFADQSRLGVLSDFDTQLA
jgi:hypothetical protein